MILLADDIKFSYKWHPGKTENIHRTSPLQSCAYDVLFHSTLDKVMMQTFSSTEESIFGSSWVLQDLEQVSAILPPIDRWGACYGSMCKSLNS